MNNIHLVCKIPSSNMIRQSARRHSQVTVRLGQPISMALLKLLIKAWAFMLPIGIVYGQALDVNALPTGAKVTAGSATIQQTANTLNINQATQKVALNWQSFNVGGNSTVNFVQPNSQAIALNRIAGNSASEIYGHLNANGQVFLLNPNGILFGRGSQVNVGGIVASTMQLDDADFLAGNYNFKNPGSGGVASYGLINAVNSMIFLGADVSNHGQIFATTASLVSGDTVALDLTADGLIRARVVDAVLHANISNAGTIAATQVTLSAGQAKDKFNRLVNNTGVIKAIGLTNMDGEIVLQGGTVINSGVLDATSDEGKGGSVRMLGEHVAVTGKGSIDVSGATGGGTILIGGDYQGKNANIENAQVTYLGAQASLKADAKQRGNGGKIIVWADDTTRVYGNISAQGGLLSGNGGFVETSGHRFLDVNGARVNTLAAHGLTGNWLLDPMDVFIAHGSSDNQNASFDEEGTLNFDTEDSSAVTVYDANILQALDSSNVTIKTSFDAEPYGSGDGDITFNDGVSILSNSDNSLTFIADHNITQRADSKIKAQNITLSAGVDITLGELEAVNVYITAGGAILDSNTAGVNITAESANLIAGDSSLSGNIDVDTQVSTLTIENSFASSRSAVAIRNLGSELLVAVSSSSYTERLTITNNKKISVNSATIGGEVDITASQGEVSLASLSAKTLKVTGSNITTNVGAILTATGTGDAIYLKANTGNFNNNAGPYVLNVPNGRWLVAMNKPDNNLSGLESDFIQYGMTENTVLPTLGNGFLYTVTESTSSPSSELSPQIKQQVSAINSEALSRLNASSAMQSQNAVTGFTKQSAVLNVGNDATSIENQVLTEKPKASALQCSVN